MVVQAEARLRARLLGHVALQSEGATLPVASPRSTLPLLAYLLLHREAPIARDFLAFALWPDDDEDGARLKLRNNLYRLTKSLPESPAAWILADGEHVRWNPDADIWVDVDDFARAAADPGHLERCVELYGGDLCETLYDEWLVEPRERLRNLYLASLGELVSRFRRARDLPQARAFAQRLLAADPFREDVLRRLLAICHESGDRAGALREYQRFAERLNEELGIDPMPETQALRTAIARGEPVGAEAAAEPHGAATANASAHELPFVGRRAEFAQLLEAWGLAARGRGGCVFVSGEAGIGKSRLALEFARTAEEQGARVLSGATGAPESVPYQCLIEALRGALPIVATLNLGDVWLSTLATLLPELRERLSTPAAPPRVDPAGERERLFEAAARCLSALAKSRPLVVVLEDLQWAGESTISAIEYLLRRTLLVGVLFVVTYREEETQRAHPLRRLRRAALGEGIARFVTLAALSRSDVGELTRASRRDESSAAALYAASNGHPLLLAQLASVPPGDVAEAAKAGVRGLVEAQLARRSHEARAVAEIAALMGTRFSRDAVVEVSGWSVAAVDAALDELIERRIVREAGGRGVLDYAFTHDVVADVVASAVPPERAAARHRRFARALEELSPGQADELAATIARQLDLAGDASGAARRYLAAANHALALGAVDEADALARRGASLATDLPLRFELVHVLEIVGARRGADQTRPALLAQLDELAGGVDDDDLRKRALLRRIDFERTMGERGCEAEAIERLRALVISDTEPRWTGLLGEAEARLAVTLGRLDDAARAAAAALAAYVLAGDVTGEAHARALMAEAIRQRGDLAEADVLLAQAQAATERSADAALTLRVLRTRFQLAYERRDLELCLETARASLEAGVAAGDRRAEIDGHQRTAAAIINFGGRYSEAREHLAQAAAIGAEIGDKTLELQVLSREAQLHEVRGDFATAREIYERYCSFAKRRGEARGEIAALINLSGALWLEGNGPVAKDRAQEAVDGARRGGFAVMEASALENLGLAEALCGEHTAAIEHFQQGLALREKTGSKDWISFALAHLALSYAASGALAEARACVERMLAVEETIPLATPWPHTCYWSAAQVFRATGDGDAAASALERARTFMQASIERLEPDDRQLFRAVRGHRDIQAAIERDEWPDPPR